MKTDYGWHVFRQNNSGGTFAPGMPRIINVYARSIDEACEVAEDVGVYFDGVKNGEDCACCGDRWFRPLGRELDPLPERSIHQEEYIVSGVAMSLWSARLVTLMNEAGEMDSLDSEAITEFLINHYEGM